MPSSLVSIHFTFMLRGNYSINLDATRIWQAPSLSLTVATNVPGKRNVDT